MSKEQNKIRIIGKQQFRDAPDMLRITMDITKIQWLILQQQLTSESFGIIVEIPENETKLLEASDTTSKINIDI